MTIVRRGYAVEIPTASMADVAFLLIVFFLVASIYSVTRGIQFSLPKRDEQALAAEPEAAVLVKIASDGSVSADGRTLPVEQLPGYLRRKLERNPMKSVILQTAPEARYGTMADVFDELRQAGVAAS
jgi:biopolymer transport protein ExbD